MAKAKGEPAEGVNKMDMVRAALQEAPSAGPKELQALTLQKYDTEISAPMISSYKSTILRKGGVGGKAAAGGGDGSVSLRDLAALQDLIARNGAAQVQAVVKMLGK